MRAYFSRLPAFVALTVLALFAGGARRSGADGSRPEFSFAVLADIQYADKEPSGRRDYRRSLGMLEESVAAINREQPAFVVNLGDLIDENASGNLDRILAVFNRLEAPRYHVPGNHDFSAGRTELLRRLGLACGWYDFAYNGWRFVVLDGMDVSVSGRPPDSPRYREAEAWLRKLRQAGSPNAVEWNGGVGEAQKSWLRDVLKRAESRRERVLILCHFPIVAESSTPAHLLWNHEKVVRIVEKHGAVAAWFNGHDHRGGYARRNGIHYVTFPGMVESGGRNSWTMVSVFRDRLELRGTGTAPSMVLELRR